ncbi:MAG TPA: tyrosine-type recombinase/integrase [Methylomusa anaerophila]|uniref:Phage integrase family protein n=1 Tax=Methylomusa anaerophila TaxID=1930071 RepID=A0A348AFY2_9FIRM|nr:tyrosine-type recombinase/integrase [Methylomusa anaerophila]BBB89980.1 phage integrase family protein [Methylomusa anaerophila]HML88292.1 tyrosine-type recombinase/integrase [Methylomusa anaerophila]
MSKFTAYSSSNVYAAFNAVDSGHIHPTLLLKQGVNIKVISERLGHSTVNMTLNTYSHLMPDMQQTAIAALDKMDMGKHNSETEEATQRL